MSLMGMVEWWNGGWWDGQMDDVYLFDEKS
jgi:hypothetical protein